MATYQHPTLLCEDCKGNEEGWRIIEPGDASGTAWPRIAPRAVVEPPDGTIVECLRCAFFGRGHRTLRRWSAFFERWQANVPDPRVVWKSTKGLPVGEEGPPTGRTTAAAVTKARPAARSNTRR